MTAADSAAEGPINGEFLDATVDAAMKEMK